jgi:hypothetical protein
MATKNKVAIAGAENCEAGFSFCKGCYAQLEEENKMLRESYDKGDNPEANDQVNIFFFEKAR